jgi:hypothetical protein
MNPLSTPPAPRPQQMQPASTPAFNAPNPLSAKMSGVPPQQPQIPAPTHGQTVAALRHFAAISQQMHALLSDPAVGKSNMKSQIIDAVTKLVTDRIISAPQAVEQLGTVPEAPFQQKQWLVNHYQQSMQAAAGVLDHHAAAFHGVPEEAIDKSAPADDHMNQMASLGGHYGRA